MRGGRGIICRIRMVPCEDDVDDSLVRLRVGFCAAQVVIPEVDGLPYQPEGRPLEGLVITLDAGHGGSAHQQGIMERPRRAEQDRGGDLNMLVPRRRGIT